MFEKYYKKILDKDERSYYNYLGINRKEYPKWEGWKLLSQYKNQNVLAKDIEDEQIIILVKSFHYVKYMRKNLFKESQ